MTGPRVATYSCVRNWPFCAAGLCRTRHRQAAHTRRSRAAGGSTRGCWAHLAQPERSIRCQPPAMPAAQRNCRAPAGAPPAASRLTALGATAVHPQRRQGAPRRAASAPSGWRARITTLRHRRSPPAGRRGGKTARAEAELARPVATAARAASMPQGPGQLDCAGTATVTDLTAAAFSEASEPTRPVAGGISGLCQRNGARHSTPGPNTCAASQMATTAVLSCCTRDPVVRIRLLTFGAKGTRTPGLLHAITRQHVHPCLSLQVTVLERLPRSASIRTGCGTFLLYRSPRPAELPTSA
jgi:hypothetical protein